MDKVLNSVPGSPMYKVYSITRKKSGLLEVSEVYEEKI